MEEILSWVKSGLLFGIFSSVLLMLAPGKAYQKHIGMAVGLVFLLVMLHPVLQLFHMDQTAYTSYIRSFLALDRTGEQNTSKDIQYYEESLQLQLEEVLRQRGYPVAAVEVEADDRGTVQRIRLGIGETENINTNGIERYLKGLFGEEVIVEYGYQKAF